MIKLTKDSVGNVYVNGRGDKVHIAGFNPYGEANYIGVDCDPMARKPEYYNENGTHSWSDTEANLVKEYTPVRTAKEVMGDLVSNYKAVIRLLKRGGASAVDIKYAEERIKEAEEVMKGLDG